METPKQTLTEQRQQVGEPSRWVLGQGGQRENWGCGGGHRMGAVEDQRRAGRWGNGLGHCTPCTPHGQPGLGNPGMGSVLAKVPWEGWAGGLQFYGAHCTPQWPAQEERARSLTGQAQVFKQ